VSSRRLAAALAGTVVALSGCGVFEARYRQPPLPVAETWPIPAAAPAATDVAGADIGWRDFFTDPRLATLIGLALENNRDLRVAVLSVEKAEATYRIARAARLPAVAATGGTTREREPGFLLGTASSSTLTYYSAGVGVSNFEFDLFGGVASLSHAALQQYLAQYESRRAAQLALIASVANAYLSLAADQERLRLARATLESQNVSYHLTEQEHDAGAVSALDLSQARTTVESARADVARYTGAVAQDIDTLTLLVGRPIDTGLLPDAFTPNVTGALPLPAGVPSSVLLRRPDVLAAEHLLRAANANIGAARAAFLPTISLTGNLGSASTDLSGLFKSGSGTWSFVPQVSIPIFQGGALVAGLRAAKVERDIAIAEYEQAIQVGFREVADALALTAALDDQVAAQQALAEATGNAYRLSELRYRAGKDSYLASLDAQRSDYAAQQSLISSRLSAQANRITLYKALGGGWRESGN
jgi:multidrug efflux system outer membrane protein